MCLLHSISGFGVLPFSYSFNRLLRVTDVTFKLSSYKKNDSMFRISAWQLKIPKNLMPVLFDIRHLMEGDVQGLTHSVGVLTVFLCSAHPSLVQ